MNLVVENFRTYNTNDFFAFSDLKQNQNEIDKING